MFKFKLNSRIFSKIFSILVKSEILIHIISLIINIKNIKIFLSKDILTIDILISSII